MRQVVGIVLSALVLCSVQATSSRAVPLLQTYIAGATWDGDQEDWVTTSNNFDLWVIGNIGQTGPIVEVHLIAAYVTGETGSINVVEQSGTQAPVFDLFAPNGTTQVARVDGARPIMQDGRELSGHGVFGPGTMFDQWELGDLDSLNEPIGDYSETVPTEYPSMGQINRYSITVSGYQSGVHFDVFNHVEGSTKSKFGPYSHDSQRTIPEPASIVLLGLGLIVGAIRRRSRLG